MGIEDDDEHDEEWELNDTRSRSSLDGSYP
jgi:hypothetical protein